MSAPLVRFARDGVVGRIVLDRPPVNVLNLVMLSELDLALQMVADDRALKVLVVSGAGKAFCAGVDVADHTADKVAVMLARFHTVIRRLAALEVPVLAAVHGATLGGGLELALAADLVFARDDATLGQPEIRLAVFPPVAAVLLPQRIGRQRAMDLVLSGRTVRADEALAMGLVGRVVSADRFDAEVAGYAAGLAALSGPVLRLTKRVMGHQQDGWTTALADAESTYLHELMALPDAHEGLAAFLEKRPPAWRDG